ncbi:hypothetical protein BAZMOX_57212_1 [methanotrophic endosymbiont of Bathymodiolus azoricus (Menez Gwen)]|nr:hypothetical protein BAZMOX_57212_1 [methanotrophic endosymbiont of Bathymodiolus azoricus (Menez Gwen)]
MYVDIQDYQYAALFKNNGANMINIKNNFIPNINLGRII